MKKRRTKWEELTKDELIEIIKIYQEVYKVRNIEDIDIDEVLKNRVKKS
jgi:molecular chaperone DnaK (HSP70)